MMPRGKRLLPRLLALALVLARPLSSRALFGVGDIVFDPDNTAQTINVLHEAQQQLDRLGSLLGVSTQQFDQLVQLTTALGNAAETTPYRLAIPLGQLQRTVRSIPGLETADLGALLNPNGLLDAFMGVPLEQWAQAVENPSAYYRTILIDPALERLGASAGLAQPSIAYAQWYAGRSLEDQGNLGTGASADIANLLEGDWLGGARQRRVNLDGLAAANQSANNQASQAQTLVDQNHAQTQLSADTNSILLESAVQNTNAAEVSVRAAGAQNQILRDEDEMRRNADEMRLDAAP
jgi:hypothetical protein